MEVHKLKPNYKKKKGKRVGRGGKRGTFSGRGQKGQKARAGHSIRPAERDLISKLPKLRGTKNSRNSRIQRKELNLNDLQKLEEKIINKEVLKKHGIIKSAMETVKVLGTGKISRPVVLKGITASASAKKKIEEAGGSLG
ncbi:MAG: 50S ribosomal protein L15 [Candidatus Jorgensenbacteria bacterium GW2011_GWA2_45_13]|uniref:Large ribosomal subunit protein uL15 n=1 Tax=Candidatus Jorgensenbacteria bacterium GW2011_GWA2_45_13 TaxID=1618662 RepID=A0A0G1L531_9BACT|nr:MAG: 50S ribosomal protein L15 [Candidatus Jorgensenbacteria bacterium GW2011_GWA2_45_13]